MSETSHPASVPMKGNNNGKTIKNEEDKRDIHLRDIKLKKKKKKWNKADARRGGKGDK